MQLASRSLATMGIYDHQKTSTTLIIDSKVAKKKKQTNSSNRNNIAINCNCKQQQTNKQHNHAHNQPHTSPKWADLNSRAWPCVRVG